MAVAAVFILFQLNRQVHPDQGTCRRLVWSEWGPWSSKCELTEGGECMNGRFRSCLCAPVTVLDSDECQRVLGGERLNWIYCKDSDCEKLQEPSDEGPTPTLVTRPGTVPRNNPTNFVRNSQAKYIMEIPGYGPNNQYSGTITLKFYTEISILKYQALFIL